MPEENPTKSMQHIMSLLESAKTHATSWFGSLDKPARHTHQLAPRKAYVLQVCCTLPSAKRFYYRVFNTFRRRRCCCPDAKAMGAVFWLVDTCPGESATGFLCKPSPCQWATILKDEQWTRIIPPDAQEIQDGCHRAEPSLCPSDIQMYALPERIRLWLLYMDAHQSWLLFVIHRNISHAKMGGWVERPFRGHR